jgi:hypothetical protein
MTNTAKITWATGPAPVGAIITAEDGTSWQMINETEAIPYVKPPPQRRFYAGSKGKPNRRILYTNRHGTYHATKGWRR